jgi:23S rRNA (adenine2503-C2)-methyltransferase
MTAAAPAAATDAPAAPSAGARTPVEIGFGPRPRRSRAAVPRHLADLDPAGRKAAAAELGDSPFRGAQVAAHYFGRLETDPTRWTDIPAASRQRLADALTPPLMTRARTLVADRGATVKDVWQLTDGALVESVLMRYPGRDTVCVSSQAGCGMNCPFCATGQAGLTRNLTAAEIVDQVVAAARSLSRGEVAGGPGRLDNVVFMGMGEPLANYRAVVQAVRTLVTPAPDGLGLSRRHVTVSTVGLVPAIDKLAAEGLGVRLALSLHAPDDELRDELIPVNTRWKVGEALDAARRYFETTGRRVSIEYALIRDMNDQAHRAALLARELKARGGPGWVHVNPIPLNPTPGSKWTASDPAVEAEFVATLLRAGIATTVRDTRGRDIDGACGQLAAQV